MIVLVLWKEVERSISEKLKEAFKEEACNLILFLSISGQKKKKRARHVMKRMLIDIRSERYKKQKTKKKSKKQRQNIWNSWLEVIWKEKEEKRWEKS